MSARVGSSGRALMTSGALMIYSQGRRAFSFHVVKKLEKVGSTYLLFEIDAVQCECARYDGEGHKVAIGQELGRSECRESVDEKCACGLELAYGEEVKAAIDFEAVTTVPVTAFLDELVCLGKVSRDKLVVAEKDADADEHEHDVYSRSQTGRLFECSLLRLDRFFLPRVLSMRRRWC